MACSSARAAEPRSGSAPKSAAASASAGEALVHARAAWDRGTFSAAEPLYKEALEKGGLAPDEVLEGYVRLGAIRASLGKRDAALAAFRAASILDADFVVPRQAGPKGAALAERAKRDTAALGSLKLTLDAPAEVTAGKPFTVTARLDKAHVPAISKLGVTAREGADTEELHRREVPSAETVTVEVPGSVGRSSASLLVRVDALDARKNRLASSESEVRILEVTRAGLVARAPTPATGKGTGTGVGETTEPPHTPSRDEGSSKGGFFSSPWPYVVAVVLVAGAGAAYWYLRPPEEVSLGQVGVRVQP